MIIENQKMIISDFERYCLFIVKNNKVIINQRTFFIYGEIEYSKGGSTFEFL